MFMHSIQLSNLLATYDLKKKNSEAKYIWFRRIKSFSHILRRYITTTLNEDESTYTTRVKKEKKKSWIILIMWRQYYCAYCVPAIRLVFASSSSFAKILAMPKSEIFGFIPSSNKILLGFKSLWMIVNLEYSCR